LTASAYWYLQSHVVMNGFTADTAELYKELSFLACINPLVSAITCCNEWLYNGHCCTRSYPSLPASGRLYLQSCLVMVTVDTAVHRAKSHRLHLQSHFVLNGTEKCSTPFGDHKESLLRQQPEALDWIVSLLGTACGVDCRQHIHDLTTQAVPCDCLFFDPKTT